jgi:hypothetical protein
MVTVQTILSKRRGDHLESEGRRRVLYSYMKRRFGIRSSCNGYGRRADHQKGIRVTAMKLRRCTFALLGFGARDENIKFAKRLYDAGIKINLMVGPSFPPDAPARPAMPDFPGMRPGQPLSLADPARSKDYFQFLLDKREASGVVLAPWNWITRSIGQTAIGIFRCPAKARSSA